MFATTPRDAIMQGPMLLNMRRLTALTVLRLIGPPNLTGRAPVAALSTCLPPDLVTLQLAESGIPEVGQLFVSLTLCEVLQGGGELVGCRRMCFAVAANIVCVLLQLHAVFGSTQRTLVG